MKTNYLYICLLLLVMPIAGQAQRYFGVATGNWSGMNSLYLDPANIACATDKYTIDVFSVNMGFDNNSAMLTHNIFKTGNILRQDNVNIHDVVNFTDRNLISVMGPYMEYRLPGLMVKLDNNQTIALTTRIRSFNTINNFSQDFLRSILDIDFRNSIGDYKVAMNNLNWTANTWSEIGLSYANVLYKKDKHKVTGGFTFRYLNGIAYSSIVSKQFNGDYNSESKIVTFNSDVHITSNIMNTQGMNSKSISSWLLGNNGGHGWGGDVGLNYEYRPGNEEDMYKIKVSFAITDIGAINYATNNQQIHLYGSGSMDINKMSDSVKNYNSFVSYANASGLKADTTKAAAKVHLPTALVAGVDYNINNLFFASIMYNGNLVSRTIYGNSYYSQVTVTPRYDTHKFAVGLPITYSTLSQKMKMGLGLRYGGFYVGSDDMMAFVASNQTGMNIYAGAFFHINPKPGPFHFPFTRTYKVKQQKKTKAAGCKSCLNG